jgi:hypothetical protein
MNEVPPSWRLAEWCAFSNEKKGKKMGGGYIISGYGTLSSAAHLFPPSLL